MSDNPRGIGNNPAPSGIPMMDEEFEDIGDNADRVGRPGSITRNGPAPTDEAD